MKHSYFRQNGTPLGNSFSINTPVEFYPGKLRYVDLEIDILKEPEGKGEIIEEDLFAWYLEHDYLSEELACCARKTAEELKAKLIGP